MSYAARDLTNVTTWHRMRSGDPLVGLCGATTNPNPNDCGLTNQNGAVNCPRCIEAILLQTPNTAAQNRPAVTNSAERAHRRGVAEVAGEEVKAADISDATILALCENPPMPLGATLWDIQEALPQFPPKIVLAKLRQMVNKGRLACCACGCRGDFHAPDVDPLGVLDGRIAAGEVRE